jgi:hypothetical protein
VVAEHDVLRDGERLDEPEMLVHHEDARVERVARSVEVNVAATKEDLAFVRPVETREDVRERALPAPFSSSACTSRRRPPRSRHRRSRRRLGSVL